MIKNKCSKTLSGKHSFTERHIISDEYCTYDTRVIKFYLRCQFCELINDTDEKIIWKQDDKKAKDDWVSSMG